MMHFEASSMLNDLDGGTLGDQLSAAIHEVAKSVVHHGDGKRKGKVVLELTVDRVKGASQVQITHKLQYKQLTTRGDLAETRVNEAPMYVSKSGVWMTPDGQIDFIEQAKAEQERANG